MFALSLLSHGFPDSICLGIQLHSMDYLPMDFSGLAGQGANILGPPTATLQTSPERPQETLPDQEQDWAHKGCSLLLPAGRVCTGAQEVGPEPWGSQRLPICERAL